MVSEEHGSEVCHPLASQNDFMIYWNIGAQKEGIDVCMYVHVFVSSSMLLYMDTNCKKWARGGEGRGGGFGKLPFKNEKLASGLVTSFTTQWEVYMLVP